MIMDGFKIALLGMTVVFAFLGLLFLLVRLSTKLLEPLTKNEARTMEATITRRSPIGNGRLIAVISAAIASHRARVSSRMG